MLHEISKCNTISTNSLFRYPTESCENLYFNCDTTINFRQYVYIKKEIFRNILRISVGRKKTKNKKMVLIKYKIKLNCLHFQMKATLIL